MKILIYGAGVQGCELAHALNQKEHEITLLARGKWKENIDRNGLTIRHYVQMKTTRERIRTIDKLKTEDEYDVMFVLVQYSQLDEIYPIIARNKTQKIVFVGNNADAKQTEKILQKRSVSKKEVAFAFQSCGGRRENGQIISIYMRMKMTLGGAEGPLRDEFKAMIQNLFENTDAQIEFEDYMDAWLKCHLAFILPICYLCYNVDGQLTRASKRQCKEVIDAAGEGYNVLKKCGVPIRPQKDEFYFQKGLKRKLMEAMIFVMCKTVIGKLAAGDHAMHAVNEMKTLDCHFERYILKAGLNMPNWNKLKAEIRVEGMQR